MRIKYYEIYLLMKYQQNLNIVEILCLKNIVDIKISLEYGGIL